MPVLYLDVLMAVNLLIDFLLLSVTARLLRLPGKKGRLLAGASAGALSSCMILLPAMPAAVSVLLKLAAAAAVVRLAFRWFGWRSYFKQMAVFFISSTLLAGIAYALVIFAAPEGLYVVDGVVYYNISPPDAGLPDCDLLFFSLAGGSLLAQKKRPSLWNTVSCWIAGRGCSPFRLFTIPAIASVMFSAGSRSPLWIVRRFRNIFRKSCTERSPPPCLPILSGGRGNGRLYNSCPFPAPPSSLSFLGRRRIASRLSSLTYVFD